MELSAEDNVFSSQPCRDNMLYLLRLIDEMLISEVDTILPVLHFPSFFLEAYCFSTEFLLFSQFIGSASDFHLTLELEHHKDYSSALKEVMIGGDDEQTSRYWHFEPSSPLLSIKKKEKELLLGVTFLTVWFFYLSENR